MDEILAAIRQHVWCILFFVWGIPLGYYRSRFRKIVYRTDSWLINIKPVFVRETKALFSTMYPDDAVYLHFRNFYRWYLLVYGVLFTLWYVFG